MKHATSTFALAAAVLLVFVVSAGCGSSSCSPCPEPQPPEPPPFEVHKAWFGDNEYVGTPSCLQCHSDIGEEVLDTGHWNWQGVSANITGRETETHGKTDLLNNFCIAIPSNEGRCTQCHIGYGWDDKTFDHLDPDNIDCLCCHDQTGTYKKAPKTAGRPEADVDLQAVALSVGENSGRPGRVQCGKCHYFAGGGDNVKHGDLCATLNETTREFDVHMGLDGANMDCIVCHQVIDHGMGGMPIHSVDEGNMLQCWDCHSGDNAPDHSSISTIFNIAAHGNLDCRVCHIPAFSRNRKTKVEWYWADAGDGDRVPVIDEDGRPDYDKKKGSFVWEDDVRPTLLWYDGKWDRMIINENDTYAETPVVLARPSAEPNGSGARIYPFKKMIGNQVADPQNQRIMVPHLFGGKGGPNPYWAKFDWHLALVDGSKYTGQPYSGTFGFVDTVMYLTLNHEIAPKENALGYGNACSDCHGAGKIDWGLLGRSGDPASKPSAK